METSADPYQQLRTDAPTPEDEICHCSPREAIMLRDGLTKNPFYCVECNGEVPPEKLGIDEEFANTIAHWRSVYDSLYRLWLDSGEYETLAAERLADPEGQVNRNGREIVARLNDIVPTYYWWFLDNYLDDSVEMLICPVCAEPTAEYKNRNFRVCANCRIMG